uniref:Uncharacterized protein n=1 Tax=viral metagenome TaxID=1070528 RepID=A0A6C0KNN8_9ZZZZ
MDRDYTTVNVLSRDQQPTTTQITRPTSYQTFCLNVEIFIKNVILLICLLGLGSMFVVIVMLILKSYRS